MKKTFLFSVVIILLLILIKVIAPYLLTVNQKKQELVTAERKQQDFTEITEKAFGRKVTIKNTTHFTTVDPKFDFHGDGTTMILFELDKNQEIDLASLKNYPKSSTTPGGQKVLSIPWHNAYFNSTEIEALNFIFNDKIETDYATADSYMTIKNKFYSYLAIVNDESEKSVKLEKNIYASLLYRQFNSEHGTFLTNAEFYLYDPVEKILISVSKDT